MGDNTHSRGGSDRLRINLNEDYEVAHWTRKFGISREVLKDAIDEVGDHVHDVDEYLQERESAGRSHSA
jgi:hypothetical protein